MLGAPLQVPVVGLSVEEFVVLFVTSLAGGAFGAASGLVGEVAQRLFYAHSGTHVDPPAIAIATMMFVVTGLHLVGVLPNTGYL